MITAIDELELQFQQIVKDMNVHPASKQFYRYPQHDGAAHIEAIEGEFNYVVAECVGPVLMSYIFSRSSKCTTIRLPANPIANVFTIQTIGYFNRLRSSHDLN
jgi:hypothetical protein